MENIEKIYNKNGCSLLHFACENGYIDVVKNILTTEDLTKSLYIQDKQGNTPLHIVTSKKNIELIKLILLHGHTTIINVKNSIGHTPLMLAIVLNEKEIIQLFIDKINFDIHGPKLHINTRDGHGASALMYAIKHKNVEIVHLLIENGASINIRDNNNQSPLMLAISNHDISIIRLLISYNVPITEDELMLASKRNDNIEIINILLIATNYKPEYCALLLLMSVLNENYNLALNILKKGITNPNLWNTKYIENIIQKNGIIIYNCRRCNYDLLQNLPIISLQKNINITKLLISNDITTCPHLLHKLLTNSILNHNNDIIELLMKKEPSQFINLRTEDEGITALYLAIKLRYPIKTIELLISNGADINMLSNNNYSALHASCILGNIETVKCLIGHGARINLQSRIEKYTALHLATMKGYTDIVEYLIYKRADIIILDKKERSALELARKNEHIKIAKILVKNGARQSFLSKIYHFF